MTNFFKKSFACKLAICLVTSSPAIFAGQHFVEKDEFHGTTYISFALTSVEKTKAGFDIDLLNFDKNEKTMDLFIMGPIGVDCGKKGLELKSQDGTIHPIEAFEDSNMRNCIAHSVPVDWLNKSFSLLLPMINGSVLIGRMDTTSLKPERYIKK